MSWKGEFDYSLPTHCYDLRSVITTRNLTQNSIHQLFDQIDPDNNIIITKPDANSLISSIKNMNIESAAQHSRQFFKRNAPEINSQRANDTHAAKIAQFALELQKIRAVDEKLLEAVCRFLLMLQCNVEHVFGLFILFVCFLCFDLIVGKICGQDAMSWRIAQTSH